MLIALTFLSILLNTAAPAARSAQATPQAQPDDCNTWQDCRDRALDAAEKKEFERFHDLAWRAVQKGPRNDPALMTMLARAQSLSGRPGDALVMLQRLLAMGVVVPEAADSEDFRRVRALPGWADLQARIAPPPRMAATEARETPAAIENVPAMPIEPGALPATGVIPKPKAPAVTTEPAKSDAKAASAEGEPTGAEIEDAARFTTIPFEPAGLAYDAVSNRFILGDRQERKLIVIGERSQRLTNLAGEVSAGFGDIEAIALDASEGDLWVASSPDGKLPSKLHKLQLISGRQLFTAAPAGSVEGARITDIAVTSQGMVLALDSAGERLLGLDADARELELLTPLEIPDPVSIAPAPDGSVYVAGAGGVTRVDGARREDPLKTPDTVDLTGLQWIRWHRGALLAVQRSAAGQFRLVRVRLTGAGRSVTGVEVLASDVAMVSPSSVALRDDALFYLERQSGYSATGGMDVAIRRVSLR